jgi:broad specificity phosphatase PhoE
MRTRFLLVRHGSYALLDCGLGGREGYSLSAQGREEAEWVAERLTGYRPSAIVSSPVRRACETAELIALRTGHAVQVDAAFAEIDFAAWTGKRFDDLTGDPAWHAWNNFRSTAGVPGGESMLEVQARAVAGVLRYAAHNPEGELVLVTHSDVIKAVLVHFLGMSLDMIRRIEISAGSLSELIVYREDARVLAINTRP